MSSEVQRPDDSPSTSGGSSDIEQRESVPHEQEREQAQPKKKETKISSKTAAKLSTSAKRIQKELAEITLDPPPNCSKTLKTCHKETLAVVASKVIYLSISSKLLDFFNVFHQLLYRRIL
uniref:Uncharacterized protein n=1 Tax=Mola mola TaxID=94237 RepID=A0A3Q3VQH5_MOLML